MSMVDYYRINVAKDGNYLFATEQAGITSEKKAKEVFKLLKEKFPEDEGYNVSCCYWQGRGSEVNFGHCLNLD